MTDSFDTIRVPMLGGDDLCISVPVKSPMQGARFFASHGGRIVSHMTGCAVVTINVDEMTLHDATRVADTCLSALEAEFSDH